MLFINVISWHRNTKCDCTRLVVSSIPTREKEIFALVSRQSAALSSATQHAFPLEFGEKWETECLNTRFALPKLLCAEYSVKLKKNYICKSLWRCMFVPLSRKKFSTKLYEFAHQNNTIYLLLLILQLLLFF